MTTMHTSTQQVREEVWKKLRPVAYPDSRFDYNFAEFIPDFVGSDAAIAQFTQLSVYQNAKLLFIAPDNCLTEMRERALRDGKTLVVSTFGICRGFVLLTPDEIQPTELKFASWLDGMEHYGRLLTLAEVAQLGRFDVMLTGASAVSLQGIRFGKGHGFFDLEWGMFSAVGAADESTPIAAFVHDVQVVDETLALGSTDVVVDYIVTPSQILRIQRSEQRPYGIQWNRLKDEMLEKIQPLRELRNSG